MAKLFKLLLSTLFIVNFLSGAEKPLVFKVPTIDGKVLTVKEAKNGLKFLDFEGKVVLLEFWGTHCPPCLHSIKHYTKLMKEYKGKVEMVAIEVQMTPKSQLKQFVEKHKINYNIVAQNEAMNFIRYVANRAGWKGAIPFLIAFDKNGDVIDIKVGYAQESYVRKILEYGVKFNSQSDSNKTEATTATKK